MNKLLVIFSFLFFFSTLSYADTIHNIENNKILNAGVKFDFKPFGFINDSGNLVGFDIDLIRYIADKLGTKVNFNQITSKNKISKLENNEIDIIAASVTKQNTISKKIDFSIPYFHDTQAILVKYDEAGTSYKNFQNRKVGAIKGLLNGEKLNNLQSNINVIYYEEYPLAIHALKKGFIDAITSDLSWCKVQVKDNNQKFKVLTDKLTDKIYLIGVNIKNEKLNNSINIALKDAIDSGYYEKIYLKWFGIKPKKML